MNVVNCDVDVSKTAFETSNGVESDESLVILYTPSLVIVVS